MFKKFNYSRNFLQPIKLLNGISNQKQDLKKLIFYPKHSIKLTRFYCNKAHDNEPKWDNTLPTMMYIPYPWKYFKNKLQLFRLKLLWDWSFKEKDFIRGTKQAASVLLNMIRQQQIEDIKELTTPFGFMQITKDAELSKDDPRLALINFRFKDVKKASPVRVLLLPRLGRKYCVIDMHFIGLRNTRDFEAPEQRKEVFNLVRKYENFQRKNSKLLIDDFIDDREKLAKVIFAEIIIQFYRDYSKNVLEDWSISFCKIISFDILSLQPK